jgi:hypothetical protein
MMSNPGMMAQMSQMMQNPAMRAQAQRMMQDPAALERMAGSLGGAGAGAGEDAGLVDNMDEMLKKFQNAGGPGGPI